MELSGMQEWVQDYYKKRGWSKLDMFKRVGFLAEETGEVARAVRALEIGRDRPDEMDKSYEAGKLELAEELGDVLGNVAVIANQYGLSLDDVFKMHQEKLNQRYSDMSSR